MRLKFVYTAIFISLFPFRLLAWRHAGHQMVAELAMSMLSDATRTKVERVLNGMTPSQAGTSKPLVNAGTITPDQAAAQIGEQVTVCGKVFSTPLLDDGPTFLNMGGDYPNNPLTAVIMFNKRGNFFYTPEEYLKGKTICVTGAVKDYKRKPEILVEKEEQVKVQ